MVSVNLETGWFLGFDDDLSFDRKRHLLVAVQEIVPAVILDRHPEQTIVDKKPALSLEVEGDEVILVNAARHGTLWNPAFKTSLMLVAGHFTVHAMPPSIMGAISIKMNILTKPHEGKRRHTLTQ